jgi:hypothetical protein
MRFGPEKDFSTKACYLGLNFGGTKCPVNPMKWLSLARKECKNFMWLATKDRLYTSERLARKSMSDTALCPHGCQEAEIILHMLLTCDTIIKRFGIS